MDQPLSEPVEQFARAQGADLYGVAPVEAYEAYRAAVDTRMRETGATHVDFMIPESDPGYFDRISDPTQTLPDAKAVVVLGAYAYDTDAVGPRQQDTPQGMIARTYAYYPVVRRISEAVADFLHKQGYRAIHGQDVPLKYIADRIGLGCYGKNGILLTEKLGSYVALRCVITDAPLEPTVAEPLCLCKDCDRCLKACPTGALYAPYKVNPRFCINPLTRRTEPVAPKLRAKMGSWVRGCDICQEVCPLNNQLVPRKPDRWAGFDPDLHASHQGLGGLERFPKLVDLLGVDRADVLRRSAAIALANAPRVDQATAAALRAQMAACSDDLRTHLQWAVDQLSR